VISQPRRRSSRRAGVANWPTVLHVRQRSQGVHHVQKGEVPMAATVTAAYRQAGQAARASTAAATATVLQFKLQHSKRAIQMM